MWNHLKWPEEEKQLSEDQRRQFHIILGKHADGRLVTLRFQGALSDALDWGGMADPAGEAKDIYSGNESWNDLAKQAMKTPVNKIASSVHPVFKAPAEALTGKAVYPDIFNPRPIRDKWEHLLKVASLDAPYRKAMGRPTEGGAGIVNPQTLEGAVLYTRRPGENAYNAIRSEAFKFLDKNEMPRPAGEPSDKANALYYFFQAVRMNDQKAKERYWKEYVALGGKAINAMQSVRRKDPITTVPVKKQLRQKFMASLSPDQRQKMLLARQWYIETYLRPAQSLIPKLNPEEIQALREGGTDE
jgi:hypothetical protein